MRSCGCPLRWFLPVILILSTATQIAAQDTGQPPVPGGQTSGVVSGVLGSVVTEATGAFRGRGHGCSAAAR